MPTQKKYGVIGDPVLHSLSPAMHNAGFAALNIHAVYELFLVSADGLAGFVKKIKSGDILGFNVTVPHKQSIVPYLDNLTPTAKKIGAVNTVWLENGKLQGDNTDGDGYTASLLKDCKLNLKNKNVVLIGSGGASLAIGHAIASFSPKKITLVNRSLKPMQKLAATLKKTYPDILIQTHLLSQINQAVKNANLLNNATTMGMEHAPWPHLDFVAQLPKSCVVSDIVYKPHVTPLLAAAIKHGLQVHYGLGMLVHQGVLAFKIFTGKDINPEIFRSALPVT